MEKNEELRGKIKQDWCRKGPRKKTAPKRSARQKGPVPKNPSHKVVYPVNLQYRYFIRSHLALHIFCIFQYWFKLCWFLFSADGVLNCLRQGYFDF